MVCVAEPAFGGSLESDGRLCVGAIDRDFATVAMKIFSHTINFVKMYKNSFFQCGFAKIMLQ